MTRGPDGNVWFADSAGALGRVTLDTRLGLATPPPSSVAAGNPFGLAVAVTYSDTGAPATAYNGNVTVAIQANPGGSTLGGTTTVAAVNGVATFAGLTLNNVGNGYTLQATAAGVAPVTTGTINVAAATATATHLVVTGQPTGTVGANTPFGLTVLAETDSGNVDPAFNGPVTIAPSGNPAGSSLGGTLTVIARNGVATFAGLTLNNAGNGYTLQATSNGLVSVVTAPINVTPAQPAPSSPVIIGQSVVFNQKTNKKGKPVGKKTLAGFEFDFNKAMSPASVGNPGNYRLGTFVTKRVKRKPVKVLQAVGYSVSYNASNHSVKLLISGRQTFSKGGQITLIAAGITSSDGASLANNAVFIVSANARSISRS